MLYNELLSQPQNTIPFTWPPWSDLCVGLTWVSQNPFWWLLVDQGWVLTFNQTKRAHLPELINTYSQWLIKHGQWHPPRKWSGEKRSQFFWSVATSLTISMSWILVRFNLDAYTLLGFLSWRIGAIAMMLVTMFQKGNTTFINGRFNMRLCVKCLPFFSYQIYLKTRGAWRFNGFGPSSYQMWSWS